jgi:RimJ/RimL family protein N-acetyltransferase
MKIEFLSGKYMIRDWQRDDGESVARYANNRKIWINLRDIFPHPYTIANAEAFLSIVMEDDPKTVFAIANEVEAIGSIGLMVGKDVHRFTAELGYWLAEPFWGKGIMTAAVKRITEYAFSSFGLKRVYAEPYTTNTASARVLEKAGFKYEGHLRASAFKDGRLVDQLLYARVFV